MENIDDTNFIADSYDFAQPHSFEDEHLVMTHVIGEDPELMYLHVCLGEILCPKAQETAA